MTWLNGKTVADRQGLGDVLDDFQQAVAIVQQTAGGQSIGAWLTDRITRLNRLPADVRAERAKVTALQAYFSSANSPVVPYSQLSEAERLLDEIDANYPAVQQRVTQVSLALTPVLPKLQAGTFDNTVLTTLASSGLDLVGTFHDVNAILADYQQACDLVNQGITDPAIPATIRSGAQQAIAKAAGVNWLKVGILAGIGYVIIRAVK